MPSSLNIVFGNNYDIHDNDKVEINIGADGDAAIKKDGVPMVVSGDADEAEIIDDADPLRPLPDCLSTPEAMVIWRRLQEAGMVDKRYQPVGLYRWQAILLADAIASRLNIKNKWQLFEQLWDMSYMRQDLPKAIKNSEYGTFVEKLDEVGL